MTLICINLYIYPLLIIIPWFLCDCRGIYSPLVFIFQIHPLFDRLLGLCPLARPTPRIQQFHQSNLPSEHKIYADLGLLQSLLGPLCSSRIFVRRAFLFPQFLLLISLDRTNSLIMTCSSHRRPWIERFLTLHFLTHPLLLILTLTLTDDFCFG